MACELSYGGSFRFANAFPIALGLMASRRVDTSRLVSAVMSLDEMATAMARAVGKDGVIKVQVEP